VCAGGYLHEARLLSCDLMRCFQHLHEESVYRCVSDKFEEEQVLQALQSYGAQSGQTQEQLGKPEKRKKHYVLTRIRAKVCLKIQKYSSAVASIIYQGGSAGTTCRADRGNCVWYRPPVRRTPFPVMPRPLMGLTILSHL